MWLSSPGLKVTNINMNNNKILILGIIFYMIMVPFALADVYINVMAVNGAEVKKETPVKFNLPGDITAGDILDTNGLQLEYNANDANYVVSGNVTLDPKASKTFRIRIRDVWKMSPEETEKIKNQITKGFEEIGKQNEPANSEQLKDQLLKRLDQVVEQQNIKADTIEKRIDASRSYRKEMQRIQDEALAVDYWRSQPGVVKQQKTIRLKVEVENPTSNTNSKVKQKVYLPAEVKPQHIVDAAGLEVRYDQSKQQPFLFKEDVILPGQKKSYVISILDIWNVESSQIGDMKKRANYAFEYLKKSKFLDSAKMLFDSANGHLEDIEKSQAVTREIKEHISAFRVNQESFDLSRADVENLEKLLNIYREDLEKSKVKNVLSTISSFKGISDVSKQVFDKKPTPSTTWNYIGYVLIFVAVVAVFYFVFLIIRSGAKAKLAKTEDKPQEETKV